MPDNSNCPPSAPTSRFAALTRIIGALPDAPRGPVGPASAEDDLVFRIHAHAARIGRNGPAPLILPQARV
ncbi:hypothetical protein [Arenibacterium halophilum]|uniref:Uncharacterized protein n=1 Tax=Arenibacterium halophilum TaxID=2583821 RepID=A0ABY2X7Z2_9RHOB|nr:hypothetical protein [Arenibacterium halophilum]TMV11919.1 hypothetical protein FGK64_16840 [Arenibacterium halophilum]